MTANGRVRIREDVAVAILTGAFMCLWLGYGLFVRSLALDDGISFAASEGITRHGVPRLPSGALYDRGYLAHYLVAASLIAFGRDIGILLPGILSAAATLFVTYRLGRDMLERPVVGVVAALLVGLSAETAFYATSPRMYMPLQFFSVLALYAGYQGFVREQARFRVLTGVALACGLLCERGAGVLGPAIALGVLAAGTPQWRALRTSSSVIAAFLFAAGVLVAFVWKPQGAYVPMVSQSGAIPQFIGLNVSPAAWGIHLLQLELLLPGVLALTSLGYAVVLSRRASAGERYLLVALPVAVAQVMAAMPMFANRFFHFLLPLLALVAATGLVGLLARPARFVTFTATLALGATCVLYLSNEDARRNFVCSLVTPACKVETSPRIRTLYERLLPELRADDFVITTNPWVTYYYLGHVDGFLRQRIREDGGFTKFERPRDEYYGSAMIDSIEKLDAILAERAADTRAIVIIDRRAESYVSATLLDEVRERADHVLAENKLLAAYVLRAGGAGASSCDAAAWLSR